MPVLAPRYDVGEFRQPHRKKIGNAITHVDGNKLTVDFEKWIRLGRSGR
jgi:hypothetical protein